MPSAVTSTGKRRVKWALFLGGAAMAAALFQSSLGTNATAQDADKAPPPGVPVPETQTYDIPVVDPPDFESVYEKDVADKEKFQTQAQRLLE